MIFKNTSTLEPLKDFIVTSNKIYSDIKNQIVIKSQPNSNLILNEISLDTNTNKYILVRKARQSTQRVEATNISIINSNQFPIGDYFYLDGPTTIDKPLFEMDLDILSSGYIA